ncbi:MAG TPA: HDIG domain-containing protein [Acidimicrobiia bacterium]|nr:HDIG domain-containing protein [Acidimicrobiia bacterium]
MKFLGHRVGLGRAALLVVTVLIAFGLLALGQETSEFNLIINGVSPKTFQVDPEGEEISVEDPELTGAARAAASASVEAVTSVSPETNQLVLADIQQVFDTVREGVFLPEEELTTTTTLPVPEITTTTTTTTTVPTDTTVPSDDSTTTTLPPEPATTTVSGVLFIDADNLGVDANGVYDPEEGDLPLASVTVSITDSTGEVFQVNTDSLGAFELSGVLVGTIYPRFDPTDVPDHFLLSTEPWPSEVTAQEGTPVALDSVGFAPQLTTLDTQRAVLGELTLLDTETIETLIRLATDDVMRVQAGRSSHLDAVEAAAVDRANELLASGLDAEQVTTAKRQLRDAPPLVRLDGEINDQAGEAAAAVVSEYLTANVQFDLAATETARVEAADAVGPVMVTYIPGEVIVDKNEVLTAADFNAISAAGLNDPSTFEYYQLAAVVALTVIVVSIYLARFRPAFWGAGRRVALFGILIVLAAAGARGAVAMASAFDVLDGLAGYAVPAAALGFMAAILFDPRIGVLLALVTSVLTALATGDSGFAVFALISAMAPILFVSSISTRGDLRRAILYSSVAVAVVAAIVSWFFHSPGADNPASIVAQATTVAFVTTIGTSLVALAALSFFEVMFDITTTLRLLDVIDRNHPALQLLQEKAWGSFNHSLMVGTLVDKAARSIGANRLLALAAAYYHDLGKTESPTHFIENQFGISNPHDLLPPEESAELIRNHVLQGVQLAKQYRIPSEVAEGIVSHHGDGIMQFFYQKALDQYGAENVDVETYRHAGHKPRAREMAILMMADALEGACRAIFQDEDPSPESIREVCDRIVGEKVADGQLDESELTMGDLANVKEAFVDALIGHYHQRIPYPNFPGTAQRPVETEDGSVDALAGEDLP